MASGSIVSDGSSATSPGDGRGVTRWLGGPWIDLPLLIGTPLLLIPLFLGLERFFSDPMIVLGVTVLGANAHHLPGFVRAYGDPVFRERIRLRLVVAPIAIISISLFFFYSELNGLIFAAFIWGIWHALAQVYGLGRLYDGRAGLISDRTARLDRAVCLAWFFGGFLWSPHRVSLALGELYACGMPAVPPVAIEGLRWGWMLGAIGVSGLWIANQWRLDRAGQGNRVKPLLFASSFAFWWYANLPIESAIVGVVLFEAFHDVQYLTTVWLYNERVVSKGQRLGAFSRVLFRPGVIGIGIYVGLCWLYGGFGLIGKSVFGEGAVTTLSALVLASLLLHFYYDSFLWSVRDQGVQKDFGLSGGLAVSGGGAPAPIRWSLPGVGWLWLALPLSLLTFVQLTSAPERIDATRKLAYSMPGYARAWVDYGEAALEADDPVTGAAAFERAEALEPEREDALRGLVEAYAREGRTEESLAAFNRLEVFGGADAEALFIAATQLHQRDPQTADAYYRRALQMAPDHVGLLVNRAGLLSEQGRLKEARASLERAAALAPEDTLIRFNLGLLARSSGDQAAAAAAFRAVLELEPGNREAQRELRLLGRSGAGAGRR
jgi:Flp pilus assembly protein TadD